MAQRRDGAGRGKGIRRGHVPVANQFCSYRYNADTHAHVYMCTNTAWDKWPRGGRRGAVFTRVK